jgi:hypothetical protein
MRLQAQAVLQRPEPQAPLRLSGVLVAGSFYPLTARDAWGPLHLEVGLVALAPLTPVQATDIEDGAAAALAEARGQWGDPSTPMAALLSWRPIADVRDVSDLGSVQEMLEQMLAANDLRTSSTPSTPPYHGAARELERLASAVYDAASTGERVAEDAELTSKHTNGVPRAQTDPTSDPPAPAEPVTDT